MILARYSGQILIRFAILMALLLYLISFLDQISGLAAKDTNGAGNSLAAVDKLLIALGRASYDALDFMPIIFMLAGILTLITLGRRAELHVIRGTGLSGGRILITLGVISALAMFSVTLILRPLAFEARQWADQHLTPPTALGTFVTGGNIAWISAREGRIQGRLEGYDPESNYTARVVLVDKEATSIAHSFLFGRDVRINENSLAGTFEYARGGAVDLQFALDSSPSVLSSGRPNFFLPLPHLLGWVETSERWALSERQATYLIMRALAEPLLTAALVLLAGTLCVEVGTRQPLARLIFGVLGFVIVTYSIYVAAHAFGLNGKLSPLLAAWGMPLSLGLFGLSLLAFRDLSWHLSFSFQRPRAL